MPSSENKAVSSISQSTKAKIKKNAIYILSDKGYDATSMREIAEASGVTKPALYYHFGSKEDLCCDLIRSGLDEFRHQFKGICDSDTDAIFEQIVQAVQLRFDFCKNQTEFMRFIYPLNFGPDRKKINYDFHSFATEIFGIMLRLMQQASEAGLIRQGKEETAVYHLQGIVGTYVMRFIDGEAELHADLARMIVTDLVKGLGA